MDDAACRSTSRACCTTRRAPRAAILYLAHLSEPERQFIVTLVLSRMVGLDAHAARHRDLRALIYMDEVAGFAPPTAQPPSKKPILTILKQARAHGVGMVLSTQNPVDLDYKAMSNAGTWMIGRLQTERDKARILEGMRSAAGTWTSTRSTHDRRTRQARVPAAHARGGAPRRFTTRWAMSFLRGPLTRVEIERLMADDPERQAGTASVRDLPAARRSHRPGRVLPRRGAAAPCARATHQVGGSADESRTEALRSH
jgi:hypothetical protein